MSKVALLAIALPLAADAFAPGPALHLGAKARSSHVSLRTQGRVGMPFAPRETGLRTCMMTLASEPVVKEESDGIRDLTKADCNPNYGETGGAMLVMEDVTVQRGARDLMSGVNWKLMKGDRVGLVGPNGAGKSTLLSAAAGRLDVRGKVVVKPDTTMGYLIQTAVSGSKRTAYEEASSQMHKINKAERELDLATERITNGDTSDEALNAMTDAQDAFAAAGGYDVEAKVSAVLQGLGFKKEDYTKPCTDFSGGWQMKIALARLLLSEPDLLMLDEPTNHLDSAAKAWLSRFISEYEGSVVIVSHEVSLLRGAALTGVVEVRDEKAHLFKGSYDKFLLEREERVQRAKKEYEEQQREIDRLQEYITKFGAKASHAASAQSKAKALERIDRVDMPTELDQGSARPSFNFPNPPVCENRMLSLTKATFGWNNEAIYGGTDIEIEKGMRLVILGPNGCGKSTLLAALSGKLPLISGERRVSEQLDMGLFTQDLAQELPLEREALEVVLEHAQRKDPNIISERARAVMGALGLTGSKALQKIGTMSGGEKARVALSMFVLVPHNLLILDEPSNHLDVATVEVLTKALQNYKGSIIVVTHNRNFCELLAPTHVAKVTGEVGSQKVIVEARNLRDSDWEGMEGEASYLGGGGGGGGTATIKRAGGGKKKGTQTKAREEEEEVNERPKYAWEDGSLTDSGMIINKQGKMQSAAKKLTPQQKKAEKMKMQQEKNYDFGDDQGGGGKFSSGTQTQYRKGDKKPKKGKK